MHVHASLSAFPSACEVIHTQKRLISQGFNAVPTKFWQDTKNQREYCDWLGHQLGYRHMDDWYDIRFQHFERNGGVLFIFTQYNGQYLQALQTIYPNHEWHPWRFKHVPFDAEDADMHLNYLHWLAEELNMESTTDWYSVGDSDVNKHHGSWLLTVFEHVSVALECTYPDTNWQPWRFADLPRIFWNSKQLHREFFDSFAEEKRLGSMDAWYNVSNEQLFEYGGQIIHNIYRSFKNALMWIYPHHNWQPWRFESAPFNYWKSPKHQRMFFDWLAEELNLNQVDDWYKVTYKHILEFNANWICQYHKYSLFTALKAVYSDTNWQIYRLQSVPNEYWYDTDNHRPYVDAVADSLNILTPGDWYKVKLQDLDEKTCQLVVNYYRGSMKKLLMTLYPDINWQPWQFDMVPKQWWQEHENQKQYLMWLGNELHVKSYEDWYNVSKEHVTRFKGYSLLQYEGALSTLLVRHFPEFQWSKFGFLTTKKTQRLLFRMVKDMLPSGTILYQDFRHPNLRFPSLEQMELDIFAPHLSLAFEYQGEQHYEDTRIFGSALKQKLKDQFKRSACEKAGITLIEVPCWWDFTKQRIVDLVRQYRPDIELTE